VTSKAVSVIDDAQTYLNKRVQDVTDPEERRHIRKWRKRLDQVRVEIVNYKPEEKSGPSAEGQYQILLDQFDLTGRHIQRLRKWFDYKKVDLVLRNLEHFATLLTGPQGPGKGPRI
jgi:hypothetical protein